MQQKIDSFFKVTINHNTKNKKCFIYDPENKSASFATTPQEFDTFIACKSNVKLYYRHTEPKKIKFPIIDADYGIPLLKSNLQKAVRRCDILIAVQTSLAILQKNPMELLRRLPIIYIEDVCLMDSFPIVVWLMMADKEYKLTTTDIDIIINIICSLCNCRKYFDYKENTIKFNFNHEKLQNYENCDELLSIYYRSEYGGMKGDMQMLKTSIEYYINNPTEIEKTVFNSINYEKIDVNLELLVEAIDFHPFPQMLHTLSKLTQIDKEIIKKCIWFVDSGYNIRKCETIANSKLYEERKEWKVIQRYIDDVRSDLINM